MNQLEIYSDSRSGPEDLRQLLAHAFQIQVFEFDRIKEREPQRYTIFDVDLKDVSRVLALKQWLANKPKDGKAIFIVDETSHIEIIRANAVGAAHVTHRPLEKQKLLGCLLDELGAISQAPPEFLEKSGPGVNAGLACLQNAFLSACTGERLELQNRSRPLANRSLIKSALKAWRTGLKQFANTIAKPTNTAYW